MTRVLNEQLSSSYVPLSPLGGLSDDDLIELNSSIKKSRNDPEFLARIDKMKSKVDSTLEKEFQKRSGSGPITSVTTTSSLQILTQS